MLHIIWYFSLHQIVHITFMHCVFPIDFKTWKEELEKSTNLWFVLATGEKEALNCAK